MSDKTRLLIVDDDQEIRTLLENFLIQYGFEVQSASDGRHMFGVLEHYSPQLIILDLMMPGEDGLSLCKRLRSQKNNIPIILLTAISTETDRIIGLEIGADDYIAKPFNPRELLARIKAILRRSANQNSPTESDDTKCKRASFDGWRLDMASRRLTSPEGLEVSLSTGEYDLLVAFVENPHIVLSRDQLLDTTKNRAAGPFDRSIDVQISRLRHKIEGDPKKPQMIKTVRGGGYLFTPNVEKS